MLRSLLLFFLLVMVPIACSSNEDRASELYSIGQLEEQQFNPAHAMEIYQEIIEKYPETTWAAKASDRLAKMNIDQKDSSR